LLVFASLFRWDGLHGVILRDDALMSQGKLKTMAPVQELQLDPQQRPKWIKYSALDARATHELYCALKVSASLMQ
jgi:hypothetical protein